MAKLSHEFHRNTGLRPESEVNPTRVSYSVWILRPYARIKRNW